MLVVILIVINILLIFDCINKTKYIDFLENINDDIIEQFKKVKRENENLMVVLEICDKQINELESREK